MVPDITVVLGSPENAAVAADPAPLPPVAADPPGVEPGKPDTPAEGRPGSDPILALVLVSPGNRVVDSESAPGC